MSNKKDVISFHYCISDFKGKIVKSTQSKPVSIIRGQSQIFKKVEDALLSIKCGEKINVKLESSEAFGEYETDFVMQVPASQIESDAKVGNRLSIDLEDGSTVEMRIVGHKNGICILDGNHPLAGVNLSIDLERVENPSEQFDEGSTQSI